MGAITSLLVRLSLPLLPHRCFTEDPPFLPQRYNYTFPVVVSFPFVLQNFCVRLVHFAWLVLRPSLCFFLLSCPFCAISLSSPSSCWQTYCWFISRLVVSTPIALAVPVGLSAPSCTVVLRGQITSNGKVRPVHARKRETCKTYMDSTFLKRLSQTLDKFPWGYRLAGVYGMAFSCC